MNPSVLDLSGLQRPGPQALSSPCPRPPPQALSSPCPGPPHPALPHPTGDREDHSGAQRDLGGEAAADRGHPDGEVGGGRGHLDGEVGGGRWGWGQHGPATQWPPPRVTVGPEPWSGGQSLQVATLLTNQMVHCTVLLDGRVASWG